MRNISVKEMLFKEFSYFLKDFSTFRHVYHYVQWSGTIGAILVHLYLKLD